MPAKTLHTILVFISVILWGSVYPVVRNLVTEGVPPYMIAYLRICFSLLTSLALLLASGEKPRLKEVKNSFWPLLAMALSGVVFFQGLLSLGMQYTQAGKSTLINAVNPAIIVILAHFLLKEPLSFRQVAGVAVSLAGVIICLTGDPSFNIRSLDFIAGDLMFVGTAFCWSFYTILGRRYGCGISYKATLFWVYFLAFLLILPFFVSSFVQLAQITPGQWLYLLYLGSLPGGVCFYFWNRSLPVIGTATCGMINSLLPVSAIVISTLWLQEQLNLLQLSGGALVILGVWQGIKKAKPPVYAE
ncbi:MAG: DMT family transporter [Clostridiales bacterium]|nr:DMT family transporter [Clostridiales bacterium]